MTEPQLLHECFAAQARRSPDAVALRHRDCAVSYAELQARVEALAARLASAGIGGGCHVGLHLERSIDYVACLLAILHRGAAVVPLPPSWPAHRLRAVLDHARLDAAVSSREHPLPAPPGLRQVFLDESAADAGPPPAVLGTVVTEDSPAFVLCSSGSTGTPKLIERSHRSFFHRLRWTWQELPYVEGEACCQKAHMTTTHALYELFEPLLRGVPVLIVSDDEARSLEHFWSVVRAHGISRLLLVPSALRASLDMPGFVPPPLRVVVLMGEYLDARLAARAVAAFAPATRLFSIYGSTEASSTLLCDLRADLRPGEEPPLGRPLSPQLQALVLDEAMQPVPAGATGRLYMSGPALFSAYFRDPELTAAVLHPASAAHGLLYDTHDDVRRLADGSLQFAGRTDQVVKIRGFRVDPGEIELTMLRHPGIRQAAVVVQADAAQPVLIGFHAPADLASESIYALLREHLPAYMLPSVLVGVDAIPFTASGKLDRRQLLESHALRRQRDAAAPQADSPTEARVAAAFAAVLGHRAFARRQPFFEIGGSSLSAFAVISALRESCALDARQLPEQTLYRHPDVASLAACIDGLLAGSSAATEAAASPLVPLKAATDDSLPPLFVVATPGGTLGAYQRLVQTLRTPRAIVGLRDPFLWGERDPSAGFGHWIGRYEEAIRARQPRGPYCIMGYSSASSFAYEIARRLRAAGEEIALLVLVDPLFIDVFERRRFGYWATRARFMRESFRRVIRLAGAVRATLYRTLLGRRAIRARAPAQFTAAWCAECAARARAGAQHVLNVSLLMQLDSGKPFALEDDELARAGADPLAALLARVRRIAPEVDPALIERAVLQYPLQTRAQNAYRLDRLDAPLALFEVAGPATGVLPLQFAAHVREISTTVIPVGWPADQPHPLDRTVPASLRAHYLSMRDEAFVGRLGTELARLLDEAARR